MSRSTQHALIVVAPYDPQWPAEFERAAAELVLVIGENLVAVHHIGSTSIPGIHAKPVIDILLAVRDLAAIDACGDGISQLGYEVKGEFGIPERRYFRRDDASGRRTHQIHAFVSGSPHIGRHLVFRDFLREHPQLAGEYSRLKQRLAAEHPHDMDAYMDGKDAFIKDTEQRALAWAAGR
jgi:GrpB-like predicted nucleotidyltransferase (UPF0157 family)